MDNRNPIQHVWNHGIRIIKYVLFAVLMLLVIGVLAIETMRYFKINNIPEDVTISEINDARIEGKLELFMEFTSNWLYYIILCREVNYLESLYCISNCG